MKSTTWWLPAVVLGIVACSGSELSGTDAARTALEDTHLPMFALTDHSGERFGTGQMAGYVCVTFAFDESPSSATYIRTVQEAQEALSRQPLRSRVLFVGITESGEETCTRAVEEHQLDEAWHLLSNAPEELLAVATGGIGRARIIDTWGRATATIDLMHSSAPSAIVAEFEAAVSGLRRVMSRPDVLDPEWLDSRRDAQLAQRDTIDAFTDFSFSDRQPESGITFVHRATPDGGRDFKLVHYDHGCGVAPADVDGDGDIDLYFVSQVGGNELWLNDGDGTFSDGTEASGLRMREGVNVAPTFADFDNDGDPDLFVTGVRTGNRLFRNEGFGKFTDVTEDSGLAYSGHSSAGVPVDYDRDGLLDLLVCNVGRYTSDEQAPSSREKGEEDLRYWIGFGDAFAGHIKPQRAEKTRLYRNTGGLSFADVTTQVRLDDISWTGDAQCLDVNGDGWPDLYLLDMQGGDELWINVEGAHFEQKSLDVFPRTPWGAMGVKAFDFDGDEDLDIFVTDMHSDMAENIPPEYEKHRQLAMETQPDSLVPDKETSIWGNALFRNDGPMSFTEISEDVNAENYWPWGLTIADVNADGHPDAFIASSMNFQFRYQVNSLLLNEGGERFADAEFILGIEPRRDRRTAKPWFELDLSGADRTHEFASRPGFIQGRVQLWDAIGSRASAVIDIEGDGDLDIITSDFASEPMVLVSDLSERKPDLRWIEVDLAGGTSNRDGIGALVTVVAGDRRLLQLNDGKTGYLSHGSVPLYFGLGDAESVDSIEVVWPTGERQVVSDGLALNRRVTIWEP